MTNPSLSGRGEALKSNAPKLIAHRVAQSTQQQSLTPSICRLAVAPSSVRPGFARRASADPLFHGHAESRVNCMRASIQSQFAVSKCVLAKRLVFGPKLYAHEPIGQQ
jgi:hypothetical protein